MLRAVPRAPDSENPHALSVRADGSVAFAAGSSVSVASVRDGRLVCDHHMASAHAGRVVAVAWLSGSEHTLLTAGVDCEVKIWDTSALEPALVAAATTPSRPQCVHYALGVAVVGCGSGAVSILRITESGRKMEQTAHSCGQGAINSARVSPDGSCAAVGFQSGRVAVVSTQTGEVISAHNGHAGAVLGVVWVQDGAGCLLVSCGKDKGLVVTRVEDGSVGELRRVATGMRFDSGARKSIAAPASTPGLVLVGAGHGLAHVDVRQMNPNPCTVRLPSDCPDVTMMACAESSDGAVIALAGFAQCVNVCRLDGAAGSVTLLPMGSLQCLRHAVLCSDAVQSGGIVAGCADGGVVVWTDSGTTRSSGVERVTAVATEPSSDPPLRFAYGTATGCVAMCGAADTAGGRGKGKGKGKKGKGKKGQQHHSGSGALFNTRHQGGVYVVAWSSGIWMSDRPSVFSLGADGTLLEHAAGAPKMAAMKASARIVSLKRVALSQTPPEDVAKLPPVSAVAGVSQITSFCILPLSGGRRWLAVAFANGVVDVLDIPSPGCGRSGSPPKLLHSAQYHTGKVLRTAFRPSGRVLASTSDSGAVCVVDCERLAAADAGLRPGASPHSTYAALLPSASCCHSAAVSACAWSPDSVHLATASYDGTAQVWLVTETGDAGFRITPVANYRHVASGRMLGCSWYSAALVGCGGENGRLELHDVSAAHGHAEPPSAEEVAKARSKSGQRQPDAKRARVDAGPSDEEWVRKAVRTASEVLRSGGDADQACTALLSDSHPPPNILDSLPAAGYGAGPLDAADALLRSGQQLGLAVLPVYGRERWVDGLTHVAAQLPPLRAAACLSAAGRVSAGAAVLAAEGLYSEAAVLLRSHWDLDRGNAVHRDAMQAVHQPSEDAVSTADWFPTALSLVAQGSSDRALVLLEAGGCCKDVTQLMCAEALAEVRAHEDAGGEAAEQRQAALARIQRALAVARRRE